MARGAAPSPTWSPSRHETHLFRELVRVARDPPGAPRRVPLEFRLPHERTGSGEEARVRLGHTHRLGYHPLLATRADTGEVVHVRLRKGQANTQRGARCGSSTSCWRGSGARRDRRDPDPRRLGVLEQEPLRPAAREGLPVLDRRHPAQAVAERIAAIPEDAWQPVADYPDTGICELAETTLGSDPSGHYSANSAWTVIACLAHNLARWTNLLSLSDPIPRAARTLRRRLLAPPGRLTRSAENAENH